LLEAVKDVLRAAASQGFKAPIHSVPLAKVSEAWAAPGSGSRIVLVA